MVTCCDANIFDVIHCAETSDDSDYSDYSECEEIPDVEEEHWTYGQCLCLCEDISEALFACGLGYHYLCGEGSLELDMRKAFMVGRDPSEGLGIGSDRFKWMVGLIKEHLDSFYETPEYEGDAKWVNHRHIPNCENCPFESMPWN